MKRITLLLLLGLTGCATAGIPPFCDMTVGPNGQTVCSTPPPKTGLPYDSWRLGFLAPSNMEVWVETADVEDMSGRIFPRAGSGTVSISYKKDAVGGWPESPSSGAGRSVTGAALPKRIFVRWQSLVEPQTYRVILEVPEEARRLMLSREPQPQYLPEQRWEYRENVVVGLAPGGVAKMWIKGPGLKPVEVLCQQAEIEPKGPYGGLSGGKHRPLTQRAAPYVQAHPIPYDSWKCPKAGH